MAFGPVHSFIVTVLLCELFRTAFILSKCVAESRISKGVGQLIAASFEMYILLWAMRLLGAI